MVLSDEPFTGIANHYCNKVQEIIGICCSILSDQLNIESAMPAGL